MKRLIFQEEEEKGGGGEKKERERLHFTFACVEDFSPNQQGCNAQWKLEYLRSAYGSRTHGTQPPTVAC